METNLSLSRHVMRHHLSEECSRLYYISITDVSDHSARSLLTISARPTLENGRISLVSITSLLVRTPSLKCKNYIHLFLLLGQKTVIVKQCQALEVRNCEVGMS